ncbi:MAG: hypothetical protein ACOYKA_03915 [Legionellaceae bacterium]
MQEYQEYIDLMASVFPTTDELEKKLSAKTIELLDADTKILAAQKEINNEMAAISIETTTLKESPNLTDEKKQTLNDSLKERALKVQNYKNELALQQQTKKELESSVTFLTSMVDISSRYDNAQPPTEDQQDLLMKKAEISVEWQFNIDPENEVYKAAKEALDQAKKDLKGAKTDNQKTAIVMNMVAIVAAMDGKEDEYNKLHKEAKELSRPDDDKDLAAAKDSAQRWERTKGILIRVGIALAIGAAVALMVMFPPLAAGAFVALVTPFAIQAAAVAASAASVFLANMAGNVVIALVALVAIKTYGNMTGNDTPLKDFFKGIAHGVASVLKLPYTAVDSLAEYVSPSKKDDYFRDTFKNNVVQKSVEGKTESFKAALDVQNTSLNDKKPSAVNTFSDSPQGTTYNPMHTKL